MGNLVVHRRKSKSPQIGDMRQRITINSRGIGAPVFGTVSFSQGLTLVATVWASIEQLKGKKIFDDVEIDVEKPTHLFTIRYRSDVTMDNIIGYDDDNYKILDVDDGNGRKRFLFLPCKLLGDDDYEVNK